MKTICRFFFSLCLLLPATAFGWASDSEVLLRAYVRYSLAQEVRAQALAFAGDLKEPEAGQIRALANDWLDGEVENVRADLDRQFGNAARTRFEAFVGEYTTAESAGDADYLDRLSAHVNLREAPADYATLRRLALENWLKTPLSEATRLLSEMQTWAEVNARQPNAPTLEIWLSRDASPAPSQAPAPPQRPVNPLAAAEARAPAWDETAQPPASALDSFAERRREKREQAMQAAQAGMQQMAMERQAAEQEYAARKMAEAQADAEAMRAQAQQLAAIEAEAMAQRENSWGNRIKRIVGGTVSAGVGAFTGGIGAEAGRRAADEMFR